MKKVVLIFISVFCSAAVFAQDGSVKLPEKPRVSKYVHLSDKNTGFWCSAGLTAAYSFTAPHKGCEASLDMIAGYRFNDFIRLGLGVSPRYVALSDKGFPKSENTVEVPLYVDVRGNFLPQDHRMFSPYWSLDAGYTFACGAYLSPTLGFKFGSMRNDFLLGISYVLQQYVYSDSVRGIRNMVCLKLAYEF